MIKQSLPFARGSKCKLLNFYQHFTVLNLCIFAQGKMGLHANI